tara:strand:- start:455 stop:1840 length:1386 start_codon:yes stop_codon:yes gene_type:complete
MVKKTSILNSNKIYKKALSLIPSGGQTYSKGVTQFSEGVAPKYLKKGKGAHVWDVDNNKYLDYVMGCQPLLLGYADKDVNNSVNKQLKKGSTFSLHNELEVDVAELLKTNIPSAEMSRFGKNGADATTIGVRIARAYTKRDHIAFCGYHGWHDWFITTTDLNSGIPKFNNKLAHSFEYNNISSLEKIFKKYKDKIAIVIMEPITVLEPKCYGPINCKSSGCKKFCQRNFLTEVKKLANQNGALLMFDEIVTGFRFDIGGVQKMTGVVPDLSAFAKGISNGVPLSAISGRKEYMKLLEKTFFSFTYGGDCIGLAAAKATIPKLKKLNVPQHLNLVGKKLKDGMNSIILENNLSDFLQCIGYPCRSVLSIKYTKKFNDLEIKTYIQQEFFKRKILWAAYHAVSWKHKSKEINKTLSAFNQICKNFNKNFLEKGFKLKNFLEGKKLKPVFRKVSDFNSYIKKND